MFIQDAFAMAAPTNGQGGAGSILNALLPLVLMFVVFYFILIRPQQKKAKKHQEFLNQLAKGDYVITNTGMYGRVHGITDLVVILEVGENVKIKIAKPYIAGKVEEK